QICKETNFLQFGGTVQAKQCNFAGLGATDGGGKPETFSDVREGVRAQVQHLKAYACTDDLQNLSVDPRFNKVERGTAEYVEWLGIRENPNGKGWATAKHYGYSLAYDYEDVLLNTD
ncbi:MAG: glucosaminidase domain-containing protein, partial [Lachnospiraceae bacterium]|nr:glucosaminidase domain-containing protein [Lachnospiraceae bacterium]